MLLALDIGNTNIVIGISKGEKWINQWRIQSDLERTTDEYSVLIGELVQQSSHRFADFDRVVVSSVVPRLTPAIKSILQDKLEIEPLIVDGTTDTGIAISAEDPRSVGSDLIADAVAAYERFGKTCLVVDFGTATTVMAVKSPGELIGGAISAGVKITVDALVGRAAQLTQIPLDPPERAVGRNTLEAMQSGLILGHLCMVEGLIDRMKKEIGEAAVIATGGLAETVAPYTDYFDAVDPQLTLNGLRIIAERTG